MFKDDVYYRWAYSPPLALRLSVFCIFKYMHDWSPFVGEKMQSKRKLITAKMVIFLAKFFLIFGNKK